MVGLFACKDFSVCCSLSLWLLPVNAIVVLCNLLLNIVPIDSSSDRLYTLISLSSSSSLTSKLPGYDGSK
ncbi:hypothetical protein L1987_19831 [Smallanthus sonchifolius]|uniref:Uncharacterized protein n=1 Tax=Smallanthus sonchifolius TaxID=185202 RepID=A0ACB9IRV0_9ASTR|nr:hypothetical protein L1987_19831 [Smallanthus sonchifolius]